MVLLYYFCYFDWGCGCICRVFGVPANVAVVVLLLPLLRLWPIVVILVHWLPKRDTKSRFWWNWSCFFPLLLLLFLLLLCCSRFLRTFQLALIFIELSMSYACSSPYPHSSKRQSMICYIHTLFEFHSIKFFLCGIY